MKKELRERVYRKYDGHCAYCGREIEYKDMQVDHIIPKYHNISEEKAEQYTKTYYDLKSRGVDVDRTSLRPITKGSDNFENLNPACRRCNYDKRTLSIEDFRNMIQRCVLLQNDYNRTYKLIKDYGLIQETNKEVKFYFETIED